MVETITREELKEKMDRGDEFVLVETLPEEAFMQAHLPGAANLSDMDQIPTLLPQGRGDYHLLHELQLTWL